MNSESKIRRAIKPLLDKYGRLSIFGRSLGELMKDIDIYLRYFLLISFVIITIHTVKLCLFGTYIAEALFARALPLSIVLVAISILFFAIEHKNKQ